MSKIFALVILLICIFNGCETIREKTSGPEFEKAKIALASFPPAQQPSSPAGAGRGSIDGSPASGRGGRRLEGSAGDDVKKLRRKTHWAIDKVTRDYGVEIQINTAVAAARENGNQHRVHSEGRRATMLL